MDWKTTAGGSELENKRKHPLARQSTIQIKGLFPQDFESATPWIQTHGHGRMGVNKTNFLTGSSSILLEAGSNSSMIVQTPFFHDVNFRKPTLAILVWAGMMKNQDETLGNRLVNPAILLKDMRSTKQFLAPSARVNPGLLTYFSNKIRGYPDWTIGAQLTIIPDGKYSIGLTLGAEKNKSVLLKINLSFFYD